MSVMLLQYIEKQNKWKAEQFEEEEDGEEEQGDDTSAPIEATLYEVLEVLEDNPNIKPLFDHCECIQSSFNYSYLHNGLDLAVVKDSEYDPPSSMRSPICSLVPNREDTLSPTIADQKEVEVDEGNEVDNIDDDVEMEEASREIRLGDDDEDVEMGEADEDVEMGEPDEEDVVC
ncbi:hypothetical protein M378DRAFT_18186 [Amanita muscaria Koide BX008]|uniref:Uncharacterized protein n=1 Tax=Amanita muscaria (strain Koide BX008) TaxID=946122 RepID=A0A0C2SMI2_AMAMK|nr:hypothetical protein M378DRAFT_18186 [Amanita muscaria Koide BX008]